MKRVQAIILLVVFSATMLGFNFQGHYCDGELTDISIIGKAHCEGNCKSHDLIHENQETDQHDHKKQSCLKKSDCEKECEDEEDSDCCKTESFSDLSDLEYSVQLNYVESVLLISVLMDYSLFVEKTDTPECAWHQYDEPLPDEDKQVLHQSFLI